MSRTVNLVVVLVLCCSFCIKSGPENFLRHRFVVLPTSTLTINGKTNVNNFKCGIHRYCGADTLVIKETPHEKPIILKGFVGLEATTFDCGIAPMTHDFNKTLKSSDFPTIGIDFKSFERIPDLTCTQDKFAAEVAISMAGVTKLFKMPCTFETTKKGEIFLRGERSFLFSDFNLKAPQRMMGMIKVNEKLFVQFNLSLKLDVNRW